jgi:hypothetical protein
MTRVSKKQKARSKKQEAKSKNLEAKSKNQADAAGPDQQALATTSEATN